MDSKHTDEVTFEDIIRSVYRFLDESVRKWYIYVIALILIGGYLFYKAVMTPVTYKARVTVIREDDEGGVPGVASILGQFGFGRRSSFNLDRLLELAKSRRIVTEMLFDSSVVDGKGDYLGNHIIDEYELDQIWIRKNPEFDGFRFASSEVDSFSLLELKALKRVYGAVVGAEERQGFITANYSELSSIVSLSAETTNETLSIEVINSLFNNLADYYVSKATEKQLLAYQLVKHKADSIGALLKESEVEYARFRDANQNLYSNVANLRAEQLSRDIVRLNVVYAEALKNVEIADFALQNSTPVIIELDKPVAPLKPIKPSYLKLGVLGLFLSLLFGGMWILATWLFKYGRKVVG